MKAISSFDPLELVTAVRETHGDTFADGLSFATMPDDEQIAALEARQAAIRERLDELDD